MVKDVIQQLQQDVAIHLTQLIENRPSDARLKEAMLYAVQSGGKRIRPLLTLAVGSAGTANNEAVLDLACALEMIHTYSLIHDDLPGMDDDDLRRGRPTLHKAFDEATAICIRGCCECQFRSGSVSGSREDFINRFWYERHDFRPNERYR
mgnify:CR=1 FL=1